MGACMPPKRFAAFLRTVAKVEEGKRNLLEGTNNVDINEHIGGGIKVTLKSDVALIHIRKYSMPGRQSFEMATTLGIALKFGEWDKLVEVLNDVKNLSPTLKNAKPCSDSPDHCNLMGFLQCRECNPHGDSESDIE